MKAALAAYKDDIFPPEAADNGGSQCTAHSPECSLTVLSESKPWGEQNPAKLWYAVMLQQNALVCMWP